ncbi:neuronal acetylcholine receptor subunit alpha-7-like [Gigantopelta aegis]|uniref:neuronal acetylcholine receptor subunit alpha-7-like n=1 Tax=Gigantopelta aegis TaxID=1735272 RepID=UPI001B889AE4|nr:neuronal acetylcholine receptor subunit alpha-7-like [Gigantopelta aegis]
MAVNFMLLISLFSTIMLSSVNGQMYDRLYGTLLALEHPPTIPMANESSTVNVTLGLSLLQVMEVNMEEGFIDTFMWVDMRWTDRRFSWHMTSFGGISSIQLPFDRLWVPDVAVSNSIETRKTMDVKAQVGYDGTILTVTPTRFRSTCTPPEEDDDDAEGDLVCHLKFISWMYNGFQVDLQTHSEQIDLSNYVLNRRWELMETRIRRDVVYYSCCPEPFPHVDVTIRLRKKPANNSRK